MTPDRTTTGETEPNLSASEADDTTTEPRGIDDQPVRTTGPGAGEQTATTPSGDAPTDAPDPSTGEGRPPEADLSREEAAERSAFHASRAALYAGVAGAFCYPDEETLAELSAKDTAAGLHEAAERTGLLDESTVERYVSAIIASDPEPTQSAYNDFFGVPEGGDYRVVPYEAEYTVEDETSRKQRRISTVSGLLDAFGLERSDEFGERRDHVALELELMQVLAARRAVALSPDQSSGAGEQSGSGHEQDEAVEPEQAAKLRRAEATVLDEHLSTFVPAFAHEVESATADREDAGASVYDAAATFAEELVTADVANHREGGDPA